ncbi:MAG: TetR/AcrR family transcriptional regulator [Planctomycetia bacterium]|nr:TetR/AcrR family transcriptional regulator [Planctomycetia bacterium]
MSRIDFVLEPEQEFWFPFPGDALVNRLLSKVEWVRPPRQTRSQETLERLLDAAEEVFAERGFESATVAEIVRRAKSSVGAMYARFTDKDALLSCLHERFCEEAMATSDVALDAERWEGASIAEIFDEVIPFLVEVYEQKRGLIRAFIIRASGDAEFVEAGLRLGRHISEGLTELVMARRGQITHPNPAVAVDFGLRLVFDTLDLSSMFSGVQRTAMPLTPRQLSEELIRAYLSYLGVEPNIHADDPHVNGYGSL